MDGWKKRVLLFLTSQSITHFGSTVVQMAIVWYVTKSTSSGAWVAAFTACSYLPQFFMSFIGGVWADRFSRKSLIIIADALIALVTLIMIAAMPFITDEPLLLSALLVMSALRSVGAGIQTPAVNAVVPSLVPEESLMRFNGINSTMQSVVQFISPAAAGALLTVSTLSSALLVDVATAAVGIGLLCAVAVPKAEKVENTLSVTADMKAGVKYAFSNPLIGRLLVVYGIFILLCVPAGFLAQLYVTRTFGDTYFNMTAVELIGFIGMMLGGVLMSTWGGFKSRVATLLIGIAAFGALALGLGLATNFILYLAFMLLYGIALTAVQTATTTLIQEKSDEKTVGRVFGLLGAMYSGFLPLGMAVFGPLADVVELRWIMIFSGVALIVVSLIMRADRKFRDR